MMGNNCILVTGVAGFIGYHTAYSFMKQGYSIVGVDNLTDYYDVQIKLRRLNSLKQMTRFICYIEDITDRNVLQTIFQRYNIDIVIHLAAQPGVITAEHLHHNYIKSNILGTNLVIQQCALLGIPLLYASSSSVYGDSLNIPFKESETNLVPKSLYAATKLHNEQVAAFYAENFGFKAVGLRFFSVYGEDMRPDMAISKFTSDIYYQRQITLYGNADTARDFTYIKDVIQAINVISIRLIEGVPVAPIYNVGSQSPVPIFMVVKILETLIGKTAKISNQPLRREEAQITYSDSSLLYQHFGIIPKTNIEEGLKNYVTWFLSNKQY